MTHQQDPMDAALSRLYEAGAPESFETGWRAVVRREEILQMNETRKKSLWLRRLAPVCAAVVLVCGALWAGTLETALDRPAPEPSPANGMVMMASRSTSGAAKMDMAEEASYDYSMDAGAAAYGTSAPQIEAQTARKLVRTADLTLRTQQFDVLAETIHSRTADIGGYVESLYQSGENGSRRLNLYLRVPAEKLDEFLSGVEGLGRVTSRSESTTDMTTQYVDNQARLETLYTKRDRLTELLAKAEDVSDLIEIEGAIADTQYQIDSYESTQRHIDQQVDLSAVSVTLVEEKPSDAMTDAEISLGQRLAAALKGSVKWLGGFLRDLLVFIVMILPVAVPAAILWLAVHFIRRRKHRN